MATSAPRFATAADLVRIGRFNATATAFPNHLTVRELFEAQVERHGPRTAVLCDHDTIPGSSSLTFAQLNQRANRLAHVLRAGGAKPGQVVALMVERSAAMITGILGVIKAGAAYLPIAADHPADRIAYLLRDAGVNILLVHARTAGRVGFGGRIINLDDDEAYRGPPENPAPLHGERDLAYVIYTSGSTGKPKGVMIEHRSLVNRLHWMQHRYPIGRGDVILQKTPYFFDVSVWELFWWALHGATLCFLPPGAEGNPLAIVQTIDQHRVSVMHFVPSMLNVFLEYLDGKPPRVVDRLASVRRVFASGEALTTSHVRKFNTVWGMHTGARLTNLYGPTEATVDVSFFDCPTHNDLGTIPIGRPIHNTRFYVIREGRQVAIGEAGELCIAGVCLARGYLNNSTLTAEKFTDNPANPGERIYRTGDVARWLPDGNIEFLGREDYQVKIRGLRIELGEIENTTMEYPGISDCVAVVKRYSENVCVIVTYLVCKAPVDVDGLKQYLRQRLPDYMVPHRFVTVDRIPMTASGKADRKALPEPTMDMRPA